MAVLDPVKLVITNYPKARKSGWKPKTTLKMKVQVSGKFLFQENFTLKGKTLWKSQQQIFPFNFW